MLVRDFFACCGQLALFCPFHTHTHTHPSPTHVIFRNFVSFHGNFPAHPGAIPTRAFPMKKAHTCAALGRCLSASNNSRRHSGTHGKSMCGPHLLPRRSASCPKDLKKIRGMDGEEGGGGGYITILGPGRGKESGGLGRRRAVANSQIAGSAFCFFLRKKCAVKKTLVLRPFCHCETREICAVVFSPSASSPTTHFRM